MEERRTPTSDKVLALINSIVPDLRTGQSSGPKKTVVQVAFSPAFVGLPRVIMTPYNGMDVWLTEVTVAYFKWSNDSPSQDVTIDWIAMRKSP